MPCPSQNPLALYCLTDTVPDPWSHGRCSSQSSPNLLSNPDALFTPASPRHTILSYISVQWTLASAPKETFSILSMENCYSSLRPNSNLFFIWETEPHSPIMNQSFYRDSTEFAHKTMETLITMHCKCCSNGYFLQESVNLARAEFFVILLYITLGTQHGVARLQM